MELDLFSEVAVFDAQGNFLGVKPCGWLVVYLDQGLRFKGVVNVNGVNVNARINIRDPFTKQLVTTPVLLDGSGGVIVDPSASNCRFIVRHGYQELDFNLLPLF